MSTFSPFFQKWKDGTDLTPSRFMSFEASGEASPVTFTKTVVRDPLPRLIDVDRAAPGALVLPCPASHLWQSARGHQVLYDAAQLGGHGRHAGVHLDSIRVGVDAELEHLATLLPVGEVRRDGSVGLAVKLSLLALVQPAVHSFYEVLL